MSGIYYVDIFNGDDNNNGNEKNPFKTIEHSIKEIKSGNSIFLNIGNYKPIEINSKNFELTIKGSGNNTIIETINLNGTFNMQFKRFKLNFMQLYIENTYLDFYLIIFKGFSKLILNGINNHLYFNKVTFNQSFQIRIIDGKYKITFKECIFKGNLILMDIKKGNITINLINCVLSNPICNNTNANIEIYHINTIFDELYIGKECKLINKNIKSYQDEDDSTKAIIVDSNIYPSIICKNNTEFIKIIGNGEFTIILPNDVSNGHVIEIITNTSVIILNEIYNKNIKIRNVRGEWIFY